MLIIKKVRNFSQDLPQRLSWHLDWSFVCSVLWLTGIPEGVSDTLINCKET